LIPEIQEFTNPGLQKDEKLPQARQAFQRGHRQQAYFNLRALMNGSLP
jgi:hypothetical protein